MRLRLSVVVITYNSSIHISRCLRSMMDRPVHDLEVELVVVDNNSGDDTVATIKKTFPGITLIQNAQNPGFGRAVNQAASKCTGEYILILNPDAFLHDDFLAQIPEIVTRTGKAAIIGSRIVDLSGKQSPSCWKDPSIPMLLAESLLPYWISRRIITESPEGLSQVANVPGTALLVRGDAFRKVVGFDERFFLYYEDFDLCRRLRNAGEEVWYSPELVVAHQQKTAGLIDWEAFLFNVTRGRLEYYRKYYSNLGYRLVRGIVFLGSVVRIVGYFLFSLIVNDPTIADYKRAHIALLGRMRIEPVGSGTTQSH